MKRSLLALAVVLPTTAPAQSDFGSPEGAHAIADQVMSVFLARGLSAATAFVEDSEAGLGRESFGVTLLHRGAVVADNREPETVGSDYTSTLDINGRPLWPQIQQGLNGDEIVVSWVHYDTGAPYDYRCVLKSSEDANVIAMICF